MKDKKQEIINFIEVNFNCSLSLTKSLTDENKRLAFDLCIFKCLDKNYYIVSTVGLSNYKMTGKSKFVELILYLDEDWNFISKEEKFCWIYELIHRFASDFYLSKRKFEVGQVFHTQGGNTFSPYTEMSSAILYYPLPLKRRNWQIKLGAFKKADLYLLTTATYREYTLVKKMGGTGFVQKYLLEDDDIENCVVYNIRDKN